MRTCSWTRAGGRRPCGARASWHPSLCTMHAHHLMLDADPEEGEALFERYLAWRASRRALCRHDLAPSTCAICLQLPRQAWEEERISA